MKKYLIFIAEIFLSTNLFAQTASGGNTLAIGTMTSATGQNSLAAGFNVQSIGQNSAAFGRQLKANGTNSIVIGDANTANGENSIVIGFSSISNGGIAIGGPTLTSTSNGIAMGAYINTNAKKGSFAIGDIPYNNTQMNNDADNQMLMRFAGGYKFHLDNTKLAFAINSNGTIGIDQSNLNNGTITSGLSFGFQSGEGIAYKRTGGGNQFGLDFYSNFTNRMSITNGGKVGIGTTSPQQMLSVGASVNIDQNNVNNGNLNSGLTFGSVSGEGIASIRVGGANQYGLDFYAGGINRISIANGGNVGIGTGSPTNKLHVYGGGGALMQVGSSDGGEADINYGTSSGSWEVGTNLGGWSGAFNQFYIWDDNASSYALTVMQNGIGVGINTSSPNAALDVNGTMIANQIGNFYVNTSITYYPQIVGNTCYTNASYGTVPNKYCDMHATCSSGDTAIAVFTGTTNGLSATQTDWDLFATYINGRYGYMAYRTNNKAAAPTSSLVNVLCFSPDG